MVYTSQRFYAVLGVQWCYYLDEILIADLLPATYSGKSFDSGLQYVVSKDNLH
jgi:hypothetical protein